MGMRVADDYSQQLHQLLPSGPAWDCDAYPLPYKVIVAFAQELARVDSRAEGLLLEMFPGTVRDLLPDWERVMQLPDPCLPVQSSWGERHRAVLQRFTEAGRQDAAYFEGLAKKHGYSNARVREWRAPRMGRARCGRDRFGTWATQFVWTLHLGERVVGGTRFGIAHFGERFGAIPGDLIECVVRKYAPAHTVVFFDYSEDGYGLP